MITLRLHRRCLRFIRLRLFYVVPLLRFTVSFPIPHVPDLLTLVLFDDDFILTRCSHLHFPIRYNFVAIPLTRCWVPLRCCSVDFDGDLGDPHDVADLFTLPESELPYAHALVLLLLLLHIPDSRLLLMPLPLVTHCYIDTLFPITICCCSSVTRFDFTFTCPRCYDSGDITLRYTFIPLLLLLVFGEDLRYIPVHVTDL